VTEVEVFIFAKLKDIVFKS